MATTRMRPYTVDKPIGEVTRRTGTDLRLVVVPTFNEANNDKKVSRGHVFLITDGGLHLHLAASGKPRASDSQELPFADRQLNRIAAATASIRGGAALHPFGRSGRRMDLADADVGELLAVMQSGA